MVQALGHKWSVSDGFILALAAPDYGLLHPYRKVCQFFWFTYRKRLYQ